MFYSLRFLYLTTYACNENVTFVGEFCKLVSNSFHFIPIWVIELDYDGWSKQSLFVDLSPTIVTGQGHTYRERQHSRV